MRILQVIASLNPAGGGVAEALKQLSAAFQKMGHEVEAVALDAPSSPWIAGLPLKVHALGPARLNYMYSSRFVPWLSSWVTNYDAVIVHGIWQYSSFGVWRALRKSNLPYFVFPQGMLDPWFKKAYPFKHIKKWLYWPWAEYRVLRDARAVLFATEEERIFAGKSFWPYKCKEEIVGSGTDLPSQDKDAKGEIFFSRFPYLRNKKLMLFLSRIHPKKGCDLLVKAFSQVIRKDSSWYLIIAGPSQNGEQAKLQNISRKSGFNDKVTWTGMLSGDLKWGAFHAADVFVLPSHQENFGVVVAEALGCGVPVLISSKVNIWRRIAANNAGFVASDDLDGTKELLEKWIGLSDNEKLMMRENAKKCFRDWFMIDKVAQRWIEVLRANGVSG